MSSEVLVSPIITEKTAEQIAVNKYAFFVTEDANKIQIRQFIESRFGAKVEKVNITKSPGKRFLVHCRRGAPIGPKVRLAAFLRLPPPFSPSI